MFARYRSLLVAQALILSLPSTALARQKARPKPGPSAPAAPVEPQRDDPNVHYRKGVDAFSAGAYDDAIVEFKLAYAAGGPPALLFNIAQAHRSAGHAQEALAYYKEYLRVLPRAPNRADVEARMAEIEAELDAASKAARGLNPDGTPIKNGAGNGVVPMPTPDDSEPTPDPTPSQPTPPGGYHPGTRLKWTGVAIIGTGALAFGLGIYFGVEASNASDQLSFDAQHGLPWTPREQNLYDRGERDETLAVSLLVVGGAAVVGGAIMTYMGVARDEQAAEFAFVPVRGGAQAVMAWGF